MPIDGKNQLRKIAAKEARKQTIANLGLEIRRLEAENHFLKEVLFCCGSVARDTFDREIEKLARRTLGNFEIPDKRVWEIMGTIKEPH